MPADAGASHARLWLAPGRRDQRAAAVGAGAVEQGAGGREVTQHRGAEPSVERRRDRELIAGVDVEPIGEHRRAARRRGLAAQELVAGRELAADARGLAPRGLDRPLGLAEPGPCLLEPLAGLLARGLRAVDERGPVADGRAGVAQLPLERGELSRQLGLAVTVESRERLLEVGDPGVDLGIRRVVLRGLAQPREPLAPAAKAFLGIACGRAHRVGAVADAIAGGLGQEAPARELLAMGAPARERFLGRFAAAGDRHQAGLDLFALGPRPGGGVLRGGQLLAVAAQVVAGQLPSRLERLALDPGVQLGRLGLSLERPQARAGLALDVERPVEVVLSAGQLQLRPAPALAMLAEPGRLLDQHPAVAGLGGHDRLDPTLGDHRVHLLAEPGVGQHLDHVDQATARPGEPVLALAAAIEPPHDRHLGRAQPEHPLAVVEHELDLGAAGALTSRGAAEDHVLHRLSADGERRLFAERP